MANEKTKEAALEEAELQITPLIDVTFLLLIFFLCSIKFKMLDGKLVTYLPKDRGAVFQEFPTSLEPVKLRLIRNEQSPRGFDVYVNQEKMGDLKRLCVRLKAIKAELPDVKVTLCPGQEIQHGHVVAVLNECLRAGFTDLAFSPAP